MRRIDHGVHCVDDPALIKHLEGTQLPLTVCPLSNQKVPATGTICLVAQLCLCCSGALMTISSFVWRLIRWGQASSCKLSLVLSERAVCLRVRNAPDTLPGSHLPHEP